MADNLTTTTTVSTIPSGTVIATDDAGASGHVQVVKLAISTDGSATAIPADNTDWLLVNLGANNDVTLPGTGTNASGQTEISNTSASIVSARAGRRSVLLVNNQTVAVFIDPAGGTATTSKFRLDPGASIVLPVTTAVTGITSAAYTATGDAKVHYVEAY